jgi:formylmethanofuran dehydrogenase subunit C
MKLTSFMNEAYKGKTRSKKLETKKTEAVIDLEDLADRVGEEPSKERIAELIPSNPTLLSRLLASDPGKRCRIVWGYISSLCAENAVKPLRLPARDYAGLELEHGVIVMERGGDHVGECMEGGRIFVKGEAGDYLGQEMSGGGIVAGSCNDYCCRNMLGGCAIILGKAKNYVGMGNSGGRIIIRGDVGTRSGWLMRSGSLRINGNAGDYLGLLMKGGGDNCGGPDRIKDRLANERGVIKAGVIGSEAREGATGGQILEIDH